MWIMVIADKMLARTAPITKMRFRKIFSGSKDAKKVFTTRNVTEIPLGRERYIGEISCSSPQGLL